MKAFINKIKTRNERARALHELRALSDRNITDMGLNPSLIRVGIKAYPWK